MNSILSLRLMQVYLHHEVHLCRTNRKVQNQLRTFPRNSVNQNITIVYINWNYLLLLNILKNSAFILNVSTQSFVHIISLSCMSPRNYPSAIFKFDGCKNLPVTITQTRIRWYPKYSSRCIEL